MIRIFLRVEEVINRVIGHAASAFLVVAALAAFYQVKWVCTSHILWLGVVCGHG